MSTNYPGTVITQNLGLSLIGQDEVIADNFIILDNAFGSLVSGPVLQTNGVPNTLQNKLNLVAGANISLTPDAFGAVTIAGTVVATPPGGVSGDIQFNNAGVFGGSLSTITGAGSINIPSGETLKWNSDAGISRLGAASFAFGNGTNGDATAAIQAVQGHFGSGTFYGISLDVEGGNFAVAAGAQHAGVSSNTVLNQDFNCLLLINNNQTNGNYVSLGFTDASNPANQFGIGGIYGIFTNHVQSNLIRGNVALVVRGTDGYLARLTVTSGGLIELATASPLVWDGPTLGTPDTGVSRTAAGTISVGNGTAGDGSGIIKAFNIVTSNATFSQTVTANLINVNSSAGIQIHMTGTAAANSAGFQCTNNAGYNFYVSLGGSTQAGTANAAVLYTDNAACPIEFWTNNGFRWNISATGILTGGSGLVFGWSSAAAPTAAADTGFSRTAAATVALGNGTASNASGVLSLASVTAGGNAGVTAGPFTAITSITTTGGIVTALSGTSDERLKTSTPYTGGLYEIMALQPVRYTWNAKGQEQTGLSGDQEFVGFLAQNVQSVLPEAITATEKSKDGTEEYLSLDDRPIVALLCNCIKELVYRIEKLEAKVP